MSFSLITLNSIAFSKKRNLPFLWHHANKCLHIYHTLNLAKQLHRAPVHVTQMSRLNEACQTGWSLQGQTTITIALQRQSYKIRLCRPFNSIADRLGYYC